MRIIIAPQELKGSLTAVAAAAAIGDGVRRAVPSADLVPMPMADGGPGTVAAMVAAAGGEVRSFPCRDPLGRPIRADIGLIEGGRTAIIEMAAAAGILRLHRSEYAPRRTSTEGVGDLIRAALACGARSVIVGLGGSATNDGGAGMARALGVRLLDAAGRDLPPGGAALAHLHRIDAAGLDPRTTGVTFSAATDVTNPLCGPLGASAVFGPQKGATPAEVALLDAALDHYASIIARDLGRAVADAPGAGAAGGLGAGLLAFLDARLSSGFDLVAGAAHLDERMTGASLVITGEGRLDAQSAHGKTTAGVAALAARHGIPCVALCGGLGDGWEALLDLGVTAAFSLVDGPATLDHAQADAARLLGNVAEQAVRLFVAGRAGATGRARSGP